MLKWNEVYVPVYQLKGEKVQSRKSEDDDGLQNRKNRHQRIIVAFRDFVYRFIFMVTRIKSDDEFCQMHQEGEQGESAKNDGANSNRQCSVALKNRSKITNCEFKRRSVQIKHCSKERYNNSNNGSFYNSIFSKEHTVKDT